MGARSLARRLKGRKAGDGKWLIWALVGLAFAVVLTWYLTLPDVAQLKEKPPRSTALIDQRGREAAEAKRRWSPRQNWVPLERISARLQDAVVLSEDAAFWGHEGVDWYELKEAVREDLRTLSFRRGASTITQQLAKNLYFGTEKKLTRKLSELVVTFRLEQQLSKKQILGIYLNVIEWGDGVFGAEAAARRHFGISASQLTAAQSAILAAMLPAPRKSNVQTPSAWLRKRATRVLRLLEATKRIDAREYAQGQAELQRLFVGAPSGSEEIPEDDTPTAPPPAPERKGIEVSEQDPVLPPGVIEEPMPVTEEPHTEPELIEEPSPAE
jgi:monofunctional biosynthetic peptidoglycan transglycosylase